MPVWGGEVGVGLCGLETKNERIFKHVEEISGSCLNSSLLYTCTFLLHASNPSIVLPQLLPPFFSCKVFFFFFFFFFASPRSPKSDPIYVFIVCLYGIVYFFPSCICTVRTHIGFFFSYIVQTQVFFFIQCMPSLPPTPDTQKLGFLN